MFVSKENMGDGDQASAHVISCNTLPFSAELSRCNQVRLPSVWAQHGAEALVDAVDELSGAFRSQKPLAFVL